MRERPILFSAPMVRAILAGTKTQTRRPYKTRKHPDFGCAMAASELVCEPQHVIDRTCPYGQPGDRLWVRETWNWFDPDEIPEVRRGRRAPFTGQQGARKIPWVAAYAADGHLEHEHLGLALWRPSVHMPRWASRILLEITAVRIERLQDITWIDAAKEGTPVPRRARDRVDPEIGCVAQFRTLWESINGRGSWDANPWVWVIEFMRVERIHG